MGGSYRLTVGVIDAAPYLPLRMSCCLMFLMKWIFLKLFGLGEPERVRHLEDATKGKKPPRKNGGVSLDPLRVGSHAVFFPWRRPHLRRGAFSSMSSSVSREER